jgi:hypothetical protein
MFWGNSPANIHSGQTSRRSGLNDTTHDCDQTGTLQRQLAPVLIGEPGCDEATNETARLERRRNVGAEISTCNRAEVCQAVFSGSVRQYVAMAVVMCTTYSRNSFSSRTPPMVPMSKPKSMLKGHVS